MRHQERVGLLFALSGFALLSVGDAVVKSMAGMWPGLAIAALRYLFGAIGLGGLLALREGRQGFALPRLPWQMLRGIGVAMATTGFFSALMLMPIAEATAITFTSPMVTGLLSALILREPMRRQTWVASVVAFSGVLIVLRPNFAAIGFAALLPMMSAVGMSLLMIGNRAVAGRASILSTQFGVALIAALLLLAATLAGDLGGVRVLQVHWPEASVVARCALIACSASGAHALIYLATTRAGAATIAPMTYVQLITAGTFGWLFFHETPDGPALIGAALIVGAGLYLWRSGRTVTAPTGTE